MSIISGKHRPQWHLKHCGGAACANQTVEKTLSDGCAGIGGKKNHSFGSDQIQYCQSEGKVHQ